MNTSKGTQTVSADIVESASTMGPDLDDQMMENPGNSIPLYHNIQGPRGYHSTLSKAAKDLYRMMQKSEVLKNSVGYIRTAGKDDWYSQPGVPKLGIRPKDTDLYALERLLHSIAHTLSQPTAMVNGSKRIQSYVAVPMSPSAYGKDEALAKISATSMRNMVAALCSFRLKVEDQPWLGFVPNYYVGGQHGKACRVISTHAFSDWVARQGLVFYPHATASKPSNPVLPKSDRSLLWIDHSEGKKANLTTDTANPITRPLEGDERILPDLNRLLMAQKLHAPLTCYKDYQRYWDYTENKPRRNVRPKAKGLYRQFKHQEAWGGRLYGLPVQQLPKKVRKRLTINGKPIVELDYKNMQLRLLYADAGVPLTGRDDLYTDPSQSFPSPEHHAYHRAMMKAVLTRSVGCATKVKAIASIQKLLKKWRSPATWDRASRLYHQFWDMHPLVCPHDADMPAWTWLQKLESQIALRVLSKLLDQGIVGIPLHDGFIVQERHKAQLKVAMAEAFKEFAPGVDCHIS